MTELKHIQLVYKEALPAKIGIRYGCSVVCWSPLKSTAQKLSKTYTVFCLKQIESMHGHWFISLRKQDHAVLGIGRYIFSK